MGPEAYLHFPVKTAPIAARSISDDAAGDAAEASPDTPDETVFVARVTASTRAREGDAIELVVETRALHFFDPATGQRISR
jgi:hypothetical protein